MPPVPPPPSPSGLQLTCAVGFEDLVRGDLMEQHGIRSATAAPGVLRIDADTDPSFLSAAVAIDRVSLEVDADDPVATLTDAARLAGLEGPVRFRVGAPDALRDRVIRQVRDSLGWSDVPGDWQLNLDTDRGVIDVGAWAWAARFGRLRRLPAATPVTVVAGLLRLAKLSPDELLADPFVGVGTVPYVDALVRPAAPRIGLDSLAEAVGLAGQNLDGRATVQVGDATQLPWETHSIARVVTDLPFGKRIGSNLGNTELYPAALRELERVLTPHGRMVLLTDDKRVFIDAVARVRGLKVVSERVVRYGGVNPSAYVVTRSRRPGGRTR